MVRSQSKLEFLEERVNSHKLIKREPIKILFALVGNHRILFY